MRGFVSHVAGRFAGRFAGRVVGRFAGRVGGMALLPVRSFVTGFLNCRPAVAGLTPEARRGRRAAVEMVELACPRWTRLLRPGGAGTRWASSAAVVPVAGATELGRRRQRPRRAGRESRAMVGQEYAIIHDAEQFSHTDACRIFDQALRQSLRGGVRTIVVDLKRAADATTSAFARLVLLRRTLLRHGRDLRLTGLRDRAASLYEINRLGDVLPCQ